MRNRLEEESGKNLDAENIKIVTNYLLEKYQTLQTQDGGPEMRAQERANQGEDHISALQEEAIRTIVPLLGIDVVADLADRLTRKEANMLPKRRLSPDIADGEDSSCPS